MEDKSFVFILCSLGSFLIPRDDLCVLVCHGIVVQGVASRTRLPGIEPQAGVAV